MLRSSMLLLMFSLVVGCDGPTAQDVPKQTWLDEETVAVDAIEADPEGAEAVYRENSASRAAFGGVGGIQKNCLGALKENLQATCRGGQVQGCLKDVIRSGGLPKACKLAFIALILKRAQSR